MGSWSMGHWAIVLLVVLLVFGTSRLRNLGKDLGGAVNDFKKGMNEEGKPTVVADKTLPPADKR